MEDDGADRPDPQARPPLNKNVVLETAIALVDAEGLTALSMRRLGKALGVEAMTLYRYIRNRDALLNDIVDRVVDEMYADPEVLLQPTDSWEEYVRHVAHGVRRIALAHPRVFPLIASHPPAAPWVRPPLRSLRWVEAFIAGLQLKGLSDEDAIRVYRSFTGFLLGSLLLEVSSMGVDLVAEAEPGDVPTGPDLGSYPTLLRLAPLLLSADQDLEFRDNLDRHIRTLVDAVVRSDDS